MNVHSQSNFVKSERLFFHQLHLHVLHQNGGRACRLVQAATDLPFAVDHYQNSSNLLASLSLSVWLGLLWCHHLIGEIQSDRDR